MPTSTPLPPTTRLDGLYVGLMSGTSLDGIDAVLLECGDTLRLHSTHSHPLNDTLRQQLLELCQPGDNEIERTGRAHLALGEAFAEATLALLAKAGVGAADIRAIGCHGQTIRHHPGSNGFSVQIGSADIIATRTGIPVVNDLRNRDMVLGGQGAPLVPAFHAAMWGKESNTAIVNIGGMANLTMLRNGDVFAGFDTGPGNVLMDGWCQQHLGKTYDAGGNWAASGKVVPALLSRLRSEPYFSAPPPKSTGRELFNQHWLQGHLQNETPVDVQATLLELTATTIVDALSPLAPDRVLVCGGGARNRALMQRLQALLDPIPAGITDDAGLSADWVEGAAFAWLAWARLNHIPGNAPRVTGASRPAVLGALYLP